MELLALTAVAAVVIVRTKRQKEVELAARERRNMKKTDNIMGQEVVAEKDTVWTVR